MMRIEYDRENDTAYIYVVDAISPGEAVSQVAVEPPNGNADVSLDFDGNGRLLGIEVIGAEAVLSPSVLGSND